MVKNDESDKYSGVESCNFFEVLAKKIESNFSLDNKELTKFVLDIIKEFVNMNNENLIKIFYNFNEKIKNKDL